MTEDLDIFTKLSHFFKGNEYAGAYVVKVAKFKRKEVGK